MEELVLYRALEQDEIFRNFTWILNHQDTRCQEGIQTLCYETMHKLLKAASELGLEGNLWHSYLAYLLVTQENPYSLALENGGQAEGSICTFAAHDFHIIRNLFAIDLDKLSRTLKIPLFCSLPDYRNPGIHSSFSGHVRSGICSLGRSLNAAEDLDAFTREVTAFYRTFGVGMLGLHKAFRIKRVHSQVRIQPIPNIAPIDFGELIGYEGAKAKLIANTEAFLKGKAANNCLLFGDAGTGKSTSIKALINRYYRQGLRMVEIYKHQFQELNELIGQLKKRNYKFILYLDDLSFEESELEYKYLKALMEGGLEKKPENLLIYATSNRRHLIREKFSERQEQSDDLHKNDTVQEKLSLAARFGIQIYFGAPEPVEFQEIVKTLAIRSQLSLSEEQLLAEARKWGLSHGGLSGRAARQLIDHLCGNRDEI